MLQVTPKNLFVRMMAAISRIAPEIPATPKPGMNASRMTSPLPNT